MALDREPMNLLSQKLAGGYHLNAHLQTLLGRPLDSRSQEEAMAVSQEVSRLFTEAMAVLKHANSCRVDAATMAPEIVAANGIGLITPTKEKRVSGQEVSPIKKGREEEITGREITPSPHKDGYQWKKYGQKNIQNRSSPRYYYKCNRHRRCEAKKKVQQQDASRGPLPPMFEVTYVNEHTCHVLRANDDDAARMASSPWTTNRHHAPAGVVDTARSDGGDRFDQFPRIIGGGASGIAKEDEAIIVSCLATVISGAVPSPPSWWPPAADASATDPTAFVSMPPLPAGRSASLDGSVADDGPMMIDNDTGFPWDSPSFCPVEEAGHQPTINHHHGDMHMDVARFADTVWPQHTCGAWR